MKIVLDANIIIAAYAARAGLCSGVYELCLKEHTVYVSRHLLNEIEKNLHKKLKLPGTIVRDILKTLQESAVLGEPRTLPSDECRDAKDVPVLGLAISVKADYIISGDSDLLVLKKYCSIPIITAREFWEKLKKQSTSRMAVRQTRKNALPRFKRKKKL